MARLSTVTTMEAASDRRNSIPMVSRCPFWSPAPLYWATRTLPPMVRPIQRELMIKHSMEALLMAARPISPTIFPTTSISATL